MYWTASSPPGAFVRPAALTSACARSRLDLDEKLAWAGLHACAALPDFVWQAQDMCYQWKSCPAAPFRIPRYRGNLSLSATAGDQQSATGSSWLEPAEVTAHGTGHLQIEMKLDTTLANQGPDIRRRWEKPTPRKDRVDIGMSGLRTYRTVDSLRMAGDDKRRLLGKLSGHDGKHVKVALDGSEQGQKPVVVQAALKLLCDTSNGAWEDTRQEVTSKLSERP